MVVFLFPGQGSQAVGMGKDLYRAFPQVRELYDQATEFLGFDLKQYSFEGPDEELKKTEVTQPALFVHSVALNGLLAERGMAPEATAGHSLGEFSAVVSAGALDFLSALAVVKVRAEEMAHKLPVKLTVPLVICILPAMLVAVLLPGMLSVVRYVLPALGQ